MKSLITTIFFTLISISAANIYATDEAVTPVNSSGSSASSQTTTSSDATQSNESSEAKPSAITPMSQECNGSECDKYLDKNKEKADQDKHKARFNTIK